LENYTNVCNRSFPHRILLTSAVGEAALSAEPVSEPGPKG